MQYYSCLCTFEIFLKTQILFYRTLTFCSFISGLFLVCWQPSHRHIFHWSSKIILLIVFISRKTFEICTSTFQNIEQIYRQNKILSKSSFYFFYFFKLLFGRIRLGHQQFSRLSSIP